MNDVFGYIIKQHLDGNEQAVWELGEQQHSHYNFQFIY
jgi:hypothetical protein